MFSEILEVMNRNVLLMGATLLTWPLHLIRVTKILWCRDKHLSIGDRRPERHHVEHPVMPDRSILLRVNNLSCMMAKQDVYTHLTENHTVTTCKRTYLAGACSAIHQR